MAFEALALNAPEDNVVQTSHVSKHQRLSFSAAAEGATFRLE
jgi:hypothetical protein